MGEREGERGGEGEGGKERKKTEGEKVDTNSISCVYLYSTTE